jgi:hypothetical protein
MANHDVTRRVALVFVYFGPGHGASFWDGPRCSPGWAERRLTARSVGIGWEKVSDDFGHIRPRFSPGFRTASKRAIEARASRRPAASRDFLSWAASSRFFLQRKNEVFLVNKGRRSSTSTVRIRRTQGSLCRAGRPRWWSTTLTCRRALQGDERGKDAWGDDLGRRSGSGCLPTGRGRR